MDRARAFWRLSDRHYARSDAFAEDGVDMNNYKQGIYKVMSLTTITWVFKEHLLMAAFHGHKHENNAALFLDALKRKDELESVEQGEAEGGG